MSRSGIDYNVVVIKSLSDNNVCECPHLIVK